MRSTMAAVLMCLLGAPVFAQSGLAFSDLPPRWQALLTPLYEAENRPIDHDDDPGTPPESPYASTGQWFRQRTRDFWREEVGRLQRLERQRACAEMSQAQRDQFIDTNGFDPCAR